MAFEITRVDVWAASFTSVTFQMAEVAVPHELFAAILDRHVSADVLQG